MLQASATRSIASHSWPRKIARLSKNASSRDIQESKSCIGTLTIQLSLGTCNQPALRTQWRQARLLCQSVSGSCRIPCSSHRPYIRASANIRPKTLGDRRQLIGPDERESAVLFDCNHRISSLHGAACAAASSSERAAYGGAGSLLTEEDSHSQRPWLWQAAVRVARSELLRRSLATVALVVLLRLTGFIPPPGVDITRLPAKAAGGSFGPEIFRGMLELPVSIGSLGLGPYLTAGILVSLAAKSAKSFNIETFEYWQENGQDGRASMLRLIQVIGTTLALYGAWMLARGLRSSPAALPAFSVGGVMVVVTAASAIHSAVVGAIEEHGLGDGSNVIIGASIMSGYCSLLAQSWPVLMAASRWLLPTVAMAYTVLATAAVTLNQLEMRLPLIHYRDRATQGHTLPSSSFAANGATSTDEGLARDSRHTGPPSRSVGEGLWISRMGATSQLPLRVCPSGVFSLLIGNTGLAMLGPPISRLLGCAAGPSKFLLSCVLLFAIVAIGETLMHRGSDTPQGLSKSLLQMEAGLQGKAPGTETEEFLLGLDQKLALIGGILMGILAVAAHSFDQWCVHVIGVALGTSNVLLVATLASASITQVMTLWQETAVRELTERENLALRTLYN